MATSVQRLLAGAVLVCVCMCQNQTLPWVLTDIFVYCVFITCTTVQKEILKEVLDAPYSLSATELLAVIARALISWHSVFCAHDHDLAFNSNPD